MTPSPAALLRAYATPAPGSPGDRRAALAAVVRELERRQTPADLHPKQHLAFESTATEILYGGAAGSGRAAGDGRARQRADERGTAAALR